MKLFFVDETNTSSHERFPFYIYGGIVAGEEYLRPISELVVAEKERLGISRERPIKWPNINWNGKGELDPVVHQEVKDSVLKIFQKSECKIILCLIPHRFYESIKLVGSEIKRAIDLEKFTINQGYSMNLCLEKFNEYLKYSNEYGLVFADDFAQNIRNYMKQHCFGLFPKGTNRSNLERISYPVIEVDNEYSQFHQINDFVLGAVSHSLQEAKYNFLPALRKNFWSSSDNPVTISGRGFNVYPSYTRTYSLRVAVDQINGKFINLISQ